MPDLVGTWRLVGVISHDPDGKPLSPPYGSHPIGRIVFNTEGRVVVAVSDGRRELPAGAKREYGGYTGAFTFDGSTLTTHVDASPIRRSSAQRKFAGCGSRATTGSY